MIDKMSVRYIQLVLSFDLKHKDKVLVFIDNHPLKDKFALSDDDDCVCLVVNKAKNTELYAWLNELIEIVNYEKYKSFYELCEGNILHLYLSAQDKNDEFDLKLSAKHLLLFWQLGVVLDMDYGIGFDHTI